MLTEDWIGQIVDVLGPSITKMDQTGESYGFVGVFDVAELLFDEDHVFICELESGGAQAKTVHF